MPCTPIPGSRQFSYDLDLTDEYVASLDSADNENDSTAALNRRIKELEIAEREVLVAKKRREEAEQSRDIVKRHAIESFIVEEISFARDRLRRLPRLLCAMVPRKYHRELQEEGLRSVDKILTAMGQSLKRGPPD